jgi:hypothetical protein
MYLDIKSLWKTITITITLAGWIKDLIWSYMFWEFISLDFESKTKLQLPS